MSPLWLLTAWWWAASSVGGVGGEEQLVRFVNATRGGFLVLEGQEAEVEVTVPVEVLPATSLCQCRSQCSTSLTCLAASFVVQEGGGECRMTSAKLAEITFKQNEKSTLMMWNQAQDRSFWVDEDNLAYLWIHGTEAIQDAKATCERIPGFRLGIYSSQRSIAVLAKLHASGTFTEIGVDLRKVDGAAMWGDGAAFVQGVGPFAVRYDRNDETYYTLVNNKFNDCQGVRGAAVLCQGGLGLGSS